MISFNNTEVAFSAKSEKDLNRSYLLFKLVGNSGLVKTGKILTRLALSLHLPIKRLVKNTIFRQFCGGETIEECEKTIEQLAAFNIGTILDYSAEGKETETDFERCERELLHTMKRAKGDKRIPFCVFKITGIARFGLLEKVSAKIELTTRETAEYTRVKQRVHRLCQTAYETGTPVFIDAEESWIQNAIDELADDMMRIFNKESIIVYNTYQLYKKDKLQHLIQALEKATQQNYLLGAKLVRGAYMEKERKRAMEKNYPSPIQDTKEDTDKDYNEALKFCIENISRIAVCAGTHNEKSSLYLTQLMTEHNVSSSHPSVYFSQLLGMSDHISYNLAKTGYNVVKYVPYGPVKEVLPYLIRRAEENTSVKGQTGRELSLIIKEKERRRNNA